MSARTFLGWLIVTAVTVVLAVVVAFDRQVSTFDIVEREPVFTELRAAPDTVQRIVVNSRFGEHTFVRRDGEWIAPERYDYPVAVTDVRRLIANLSDMRYIERKTSKPERFPRLEVEDINDTDSESTHVRLFAADDEVLADVIVGRPSARFFGGGSSGTYIREPGTTNVWLVSGNTNVQQRLVPWLDRLIVSMPANTVAAVEVGKGDGAARLVKESPEDKAFVLNGGLDEAEALDEQSAAALGRALGKLELEDVRPRSELALPEDAAVAKYTTFDGVTVTLRTAKIDGKPWASVEAAYTGDDESAAAQAARARVEEINARVGDWVYWIPSVTFDELTKQRADLVRAKDDTSS